MHRERRRVPLGSPPSCAAPPRCRHVVNRHGPAGRPGRTPRPSFHNLANSRRVCCVGRGPLAGAVGCVPWAQPKAPRRAEPTCGHARLNQNRMSHTQAIPASRATLPWLRGDGSLFTQHTRGEFAAFRKLTPGVCNGGYTPQATLHKRARWTRACAHNAKRRVSPSDHAPPDLAPTRDPPPRHRPSRSRDACDQTSRAASASRSAP